MAASTDFTIPVGNRSAYAPEGQPKIAMLKELMVYTDATPTAADTVAITLADYNITTIWGVDFWYHTTANSVILPVAMATTALASGIFTMTIPAGPATQICVFKIYYI